MVNQILKDLADVYKKTDTGKKFTFMEKAFIIFDENNDLEWQYEGKLNI